MDIVLAIALMTLPLQQADAPVATGILQGRVIRSSTQEPIPGVQVTLAGGPGAPAQPFIPGPNGGVTIDLGDGRRILTSSVEAANSLIANPPPGMNIAGLGAIGAQKGAVTDRDGVYSFKDLAPGRYTVRVQHEGYFGPATNGIATPLVSKPVTVEAGKTASVDVALVKGGVISGQIRNPSGQPQPGNYVVAGRQGYTTNGRPIFVTASSTTSDDRRHEPSAKRVRRRYPVWSHERVR